MRVYSLILFFLFQSILLPGQSYEVSIEQYTTKDGLSQNQVKWIHTDNRGMLWIGTNDGINRFDGQEFKLVVETDFRNAPNRRHLIEDQEGDIWLVNGDTYNNLIFFNIYSESLKSFEEKFGQHPPFEKSKYVKALQLGNGKIVVNTADHQLISLLNNTEVGTRKQFHASQMSYFFANPNSNNFWSYLDGRSADVKKIRLYDHNLNEIYTSDKAFDNFELINISAEDVLFFKDYARDIIYHLLPDGTLSKYDYINYQTQQTSLGYLQVYPSKQRNKLFLNFAEERIGLYAFENNTPLFISNKFDDLSFANRPYFRIQENNYWLGTDKGLFKVQVNANHFKKALFEPMSKKNKNGCFGMAADSTGKVIVNSNGSCYYVKNEKLAARIDDCQRSFDLFFDNKGKLWFNYLFQSLELDMKTNSVNSFEFQNEIWTDVYSYYQDKNDRIWCGTNYGLMYYEEGFTEFKKYIPQEDFRLDSKEQIIYNIYTDLNNQLWLCSNTGLYLFDIEKGIQARYWKGGQGRHYLPSNYFGHMHQDQDGIYWLASNDGLIQWQKEEGKHQLFTKQDGLSDNGLKGIYEDEYGFLWISSSNGLIQFQKQNKEVKNYFAKDGLSHSQFNHISHLQDESGIIYFGGVNGVTYFDPIDFITEFHTSENSKVVLTEYKVFNSKTNTQDDKLFEFNKQGKLFLEDQDRYLNLQFALLNYEYNFEPDYTFKIDEELWQSGKSNSISFSTLPYGEHSLSVEGRSGIGKYSKNGINIPIVVLKPFYLQAWFIVFALLSLAGIIYFLLQKKADVLRKRQVELENKVLERTHTIRMQAKELRLLNAAKSKFMANISHEFRTPLTLILNALFKRESFEKSVPNEVGQAVVLQKEDLDILKRNAQRLQDLIGQMLDLAKLESDNMVLSASKQNLNLYLEGIYDSFKSLASTKNIELEYTSTAKDILAYFERDKMDKIFYNILGNAIKFTKEGGKVSIHLEEMKDKIVLSISDTGIGITEEDLPYVFNRFYRGSMKDEYTYEGTGIGLSLAKELVEIHHGTIKAISKKGNGTSIQFTLPKGHKHLSVNEVTVNDVDQEQKILETKQGTYIENGSKYLYKGTAPYLLIIEDNDDLRYYHKKSFENNYNLLFAQDGHTGIKLALEYIPNIILCDVMLPGKNGYEICQQLKLDERTNHIPIILITGKASQEDKEEGLMFGADEYISKPYHQKELDLRLKNLLANQKNLRDKFSMDQRTEGPENNIKTPQQQFIDQCNLYAKTNIANSEFDVEEMSNAFNMSRSQLYRKMKTIMGTTPNQFIRAYRLRQAKTLLDNNAGNASEVSFMVGFSNPNYFYKCFKDEYGITVGDYLKGNGKILS